tara:strand:- start:6973 stop:7605 length:633 start_codon:yes stop_codon:yes gene_type:complete
MSTKIDINNRYPSEGEVRSDKKPYFDYYTCLLKTFSNEDLKKFCDVGCATGHILSFLKNNHDSDVRGYEYFEYHKESSFCDSKIKDDIIIYDIRDELPEDTQKYSIVNCSEVGEHIDPDYANTLIENCKKLSSKYIIFTWSSHGGDLDPGCDPLHQHLNPLSRENYIKLMMSHDLIPNMELTNAFLNESLKMKDFYFWWRESFIIWEMIE